MDHEINHIRMSIEIPEETSTSNTSIVSNLSADERNEELEEILKEHYKIKHSSSPIHFRDDSSSYLQNEHRDSIDVCEKLYRDGLKKQKQRAMDVRAKIDQENHVEAPKLHLATNRSYTPMRTRPSLENVHDHLYSLSRQKQMENVKKKEEEMQAIENRMKGAMISPKQKQEVIGRLYQRAKAKQQEGRKLRKEIEQKLAPRTPTPSKKIPLSKAGDMYERGLSHRAQKERKIEDILNSPRESTFPKMRTQSRSRSSSRRRARSQTPSRRYSARSSTPSRRNVNENAYRDDKTFNRSTIKLPPPAPKTRVQSPDLHANK